MPISYMVHQTHKIHSRKNTKPRYKQMSFYVSCIVFFLEMKRRAIAKYTATSRANIIHATQNIYIPYSKKLTSIKHTRLQTFLRYLARRNEKESYRTFYTNNICIYPTCYITHTILDFSHFIALGRENESYRKIGRTVDAGVRMSAHAFAEQVQVGIYSCVSACNKNKTKT